MITSYTDVHTYQNVLPVSSDKFWHDTRHPASGDLSGSTVVKLSDKVHTTWNLDQGGDPIVVDNGQFNGHPGYRMQYGAQYDSVNFDCGDSFSLSEGSFVMVMKRSAADVDSTMYICDDWQSYFYIRIDLDATTNAIRGFFNGSYKDIDCPGANEPFVLIARWKTGTGYSIETNLDSDSGTFASDMNSELANRTFQITTGWAESTYIYHTAPYMSDRYLTDQEVYNIKVYSKALGCKFNG